MAELTHHRDRINGIHLHYVTAGAGPLVVLLHGFPEFWFSWRRQIPALAAAGFRVVAPDLRGYGESDRPAGVQAYRIENLTADMAGLVQHLGEERAHFVGHDWGGVIAWYLPVHYPALVDQLAILNAPHPVLFARALRRLPQLCRSWYIFWFQVPFLPGALARLSELRMLETMLRHDPVHADAFSAEDIALYKAAMLKPGAFEAAINYYRAMFRRGLGRAPKEFRPIPHPTLVIWGERDRYLGKELLTGLDAWATDLRVERLPDASHWVQNDSAPEVNYFLTRFLVSSQ